NVILFPVRLNAPTLASLIVKINPVRPAMLLLGLMPFPVILKPAVVVSKLIVSPGTGTVASSQLLGTVHWLLPAQPLQCRVLTALKLVEPSWLVKSVTEMLGL